MFVCACVHMFFNKDAISIKRDIDAKVPLLFFVLSVAGLESVV